MQILLLEPRSDQLSKGWLNSAVGCLEILYSQQSISRLTFSAEQKETTVELAKKLEGWIDRQEIHITFEKTAFQAKVYGALIEVPAKETISYEELSTRSGSKAVRAVGSAMKNNPVALLIPCHRVLRKNGELGQYAGGRDRKQLLLNFEQKGKTIYDILLHPLS